MIKPITYPFTYEEAEAANTAWGCNCGPAALAFALQCGLAVVRTAIPDFEAKRYTSPTMMKSALSFLGVEWTGIKRPNVEQMFDEANDNRGRFRLVRVQWCGPWTAPGVNPKWAYRQTHWICTWSERRVPLVFDVNGGIHGICHWEEIVVPAIVATIPRADGKWFPTHIWQIERGRP